jgi:hypothetical protein
LGCTEWRGACADERLSLIGSSRLISSKPSWRGADDPARGLSAVILIVPTTLLAMAGQVIVRRYVEVTQLRINTRPDPG